MELRIRGKQAIQGKVECSGAKNSATRILAAALLSQGRVHLRNFPLLLEDVQAKLAFMRELGAEFTEWRDTSELEIVTPSLAFDSISDYKLPIRTTYLLAAGALARTGYAFVPYPGGCKIGSRGYDLHMMVWRKFGCDVVEEQEYISVVGRLRGATIDFPISTVGGTENALLCAVVADGETTIRNAYVTPEVRDLIAFLLEMGARIELEGTSLIRVEGTDGLLHGASYVIMPDRVEALTWIILGIVSGSVLQVSNVPFDSMQVPLIHLHEAGIDLYRNSGSVFITPACTGLPGIQPFEVACGAHPGVVSDMQPFFAFLALFGNGRSVIHDYRYPERIAYARQLEKFAPSKISAISGRIRVEGPVDLQGADVCSTDLRGSMALIMAAILAEGESCVHGVELALRGYNNLPCKLASLGVTAEWID
ncbi:UDP-N-acetylglucosamine 1-carboxyvinyltransferase [Thiorhodococcus minor]|uniref:UDP-N-acetylglucosamine 1-carboxyvinyltransferase n=1 Tax=Thiorhodococcus minor TaxID=57489 RepID=A0A6M0K9S5_9GAMM|nr:UDP-N-acetylglucosamine 1-carboxyvinyltransferase [Thiorhodococcus minor]NEV65315.1 UDP-N-acetylglucosamine 1-carboxyvinyltransferase [Thiorhodococcus minor]